MPQILDGFGFDPNPSLFKISKQRIWIWPLKSKSKDPNRMLTNRFSDLPKNISDEGSKEETVKEKNLLQIRCDAKEKNCIFFSFLFLVLYVNLTDR